MKRGVRLWRIPSDRDFFVWEEGNACVCGFSPLLYAMYKGESRNFFYEGVAFGSLRIQPFPIPKK